MMDILKILGMGLVVAVLSMTLENTKREYALLISVCGGALMLMAVFPGLQKLITFINDAAKGAEIDVNYVKIVVKSSGVACIASLCSSICRDMGQTAIATKIELAGRIFIMVLALPAVKALLKIIGGLI